MVAALLSYGFQIDLLNDKERKSERYYFPLLMRSYKDYDPDKDVMSKFRKFRATSKPAYLMARFLSKYEKVITTENDYIETDYDAESANNRTLKTFYEEELDDFDPILLSFKNSSKASKKGSFHVEYQNKYDEVVEESFNFSTQMLNLCKNQREARLILQKVLHFVKSNK